MPFFINVLDRSQKFPELVDGQCCLLLFPDHVIRDSDEGLGGTQQEQKLKDFETCKRVVEQKLKNDPNPVLVRDFILHNSSFLYNTFFGPLMVSYVNGASIKRVRIILMHFYRNNNT